MLNILTLPKNELILRHKSKKFKSDLINSTEYQKFFDQLGQTMFEADGVGLASPQVNKLIRVIAININQTPYIMINPQIIKKSWSKNIMEEGCLSIPNVYGKVKRHKKIKVKYLDRLNHTHKTTFKNFTARVIQHEVDHLDGILFIDKLVK